MFLEAMTAQDLEFEEFEITAEVLRDPSQSLNDLIKSLYHGQT